MDASRLRTLRVTGSVPGGPGTYINYLDFLGHRIFVSTTRHRNSSSQLITVKLFVQHSQLRSKLRSRTVSYITKKNSCRFFYRPTEFVEGFLSRHCLQVCFTNSIRNFSRRFIKGSDSLIWDRNIKKY